MNLVENVTGSIQGKTLRWLPQNFTTKINFQRVHDTIESGIEKLEVSVENLNMRPARFQAKMKQLLVKLELNCQLTEDNSLTEQHVRPPRSGRLYSLQPKKRSRTKPVTASKLIDNNKQNTL